MTGRVTLPSIEDVCTAAHPSPQAPLHLDAVVISRKETGVAWPKWSCPNCGLEAEMQVDTATAQKVLGER